MGLTRSHRRTRILLIVDAVSLSLAYIVMITLRFNWHFKKNWMIPLYTMIFVMEILFATLVNVYRGTGEIWLAPTIKVYKTMNSAFAAGYSSTAAMNMNTSHS